MVGVWLTNSLSLEASLFDSCLDGAVSSLNAWAIHQALKPADREHRFGHGKIEALVGLFQSIFIALSAGWLFWEAWHRVKIHHTINLNMHALYIMGAATLLTVLLVTWQHYVVSRTKSLVISSDALHYKADILTNIGAIIGCMAGAWFSSIDISIGVIVALYILWTSWKIGKVSLDVLMDRELEEDTREKIQNIVKSHPQVQGLHELRTRSSGQKDFVQFHLDLTPTLSLREAHEITESVERTLIKNFPHMEILIHQDPSLECSCDHETTGYKENLSPK